MIEENWMRYQGLARTRFFNNTINIPQKIEIYMNIICMKCGRPGFDPWDGKIPWRRERLPTPVIWPGEFHGLYSPWGRKESDMTQ